MAVVLMGAVLCVTVKNLFHAALALTGALIGIAAVFISLHAEFLAAIQILIYVGAVMTLVVFTIMLTQRLSDKTIHQNNQQSFISLIGVVLFLAFLIPVLLKTPWPVHAPHTISLEGLAGALLGTYVFPFEVISVILIAALIGAIVIARSEKK